MNTKRTLLIAALIGTLFLTGCVATPYYGSTGYYRGGSYGYSYGHRPSVYLSMPGYASTPGYYVGGHTRYGGNKHFIGGHHHHSGHKHHIGGHRHSGGGHHGRGHRGHR